MILKQIYTFKSIFDKFQKYCVKSKGFAKN